VRSPEAPSRDDRRCVGLETVLFPAAGAGADRDWAPDQAEIELPPPQTPAPYHGRQEQLGVTCAAALQGGPPIQSIDAVRTCCSPRGASTSRTCRGAHVLPLLQACRTGSRCRPCKTKSNIFPTHVPKRGRKLVCCCPGRSQGQKSLSVRHGSRIAPGIVVVGSHSWLRDDSRASSLSGDLGRTELDVSGRPPIVRLTQHRAALMCTPSRLDPAARY
jgi:hypothetical protein